MKSFAETFEFKSLLLHNSYDFQVPVEIDADHINARGKSGKINFQAIHRNFLSSQPASGFRINQIP
jgi:hypothetical protein